MSIIAATIRRFVATNVFLALRIEGCRGTHWSSNFNLREASTWKEEVSCIISLCVALLHVPNPVVTQTDCLSFPIKIQYKQNIRSVLHEYESHSLELVVPSGNVFLYHEGRKLLLFRIGKQFLDISSFWGWWGPQLRINFLFS